MLLKHKLEQKSRDRERIANILQIFEGWGSRGADDLRMVCISPSVHEAEDKARRIEVEMDVKKRVLGFADKCKGKREIPYSEYDEMVEFLKTFLSTGKN